MSAILQRIRTNTLEFYTNQFLEQCCKNVNAADVFYIQCIYRTK